MLSKDEKKIIIEKAKDVPTDTVWKDLKDTERDRKSVV